MTPTRLIPVLALAALAACGGGSGSGSGGSGGSLNPFNWFGGSQETVALVPEGGFGEIVDTRGLVDQVTELTVEQVSDGAVVRATGLPPRQGFWDGELTSETRYEHENGVLTLQFRIRPPENPTLVSVPRAREVVVALFLSHQKLDGLREIRVVAARNSRSARR